jgi:hypothetical protein
MTHYATEQWIDFVNGATPEPAREAMQKHLDSGCGRCSDTVAVWQKVQRLAVQERRYQPSPDTVRVAKAAFANAEHGPETSFTGIIAELIFDSFQAPALAGARSAGIQSRQVLFAANPFQIDVNIEAKAGESRLSVTGQLMDTTQPDSIARGIPITLSNRRGQTVQTVTNNFGEFQGEIENRGDLELTFPGRGEKPIVVSLRDALTYNPGLVRRGDSPNRID